jgi:hypothetical protein
MIIIIFLYIFYFKLQNVIFTTDFEKEEGKPFMMKKFIVHEKKVSPSFINPKVLPLNFSPQKCTIN